MNDTTRQPEGQPTADTRNDAAGGPASRGGDDPLIEALKKDVDRTLLRESLKLTPRQRSEKFVRFMKFLDELRAAGRRAREKNPGWGLK
jgi:hypothetical protein